MVDMITGKWLTLRRIFKALPGLGYDGGYDAIQRYNRTWQPGEVAAFAKRLCASSNATLFVCWTAAILGGKVQQ